MNDRLAAALADRYRIERELGAGGMATVYLAQDIKHKRKVAIKVLQPELAAVLGAERFVQEITTTATLQHPHILPLFDSGVADSFLFYVMPFIEGESLRDRLTRDRRLSPADATQIVSEVADALDCAHRAGIVHRDIKPENILLTNGHAIVADFGIARAAIDSGAARMTQTGMLLGTPAYLSPEQVTDEPVDGRSDLYALGCVLYECLTGELPFKGSMMAMMSQRVVASPPSVRALRGDVPQHIDKVVLKAMATEASGRFNTGREMAAALTATAPAGGAGDRRAIVVLPFANNSLDKDNEYFSDGLTEEVSNDLAGIKSLRVISRTSAMRLKGTDKDVRTIGRELGVRYVLEGSVRRAGSSLRITAQLIDAESDMQLWAEKYGGTLDDVFELQERVSREIVRALGITLTSDEDRRLAHRSIENVHAFELYLQARQEMRRYGIAAIERGGTLIRRAMEIEGRTPPLEALLAWGDVSLIRAGLASDRNVLASAAAVAHSVISAAPDAPYGHALLGFIEYERGHIADAIHYFRRAVELEPNDADALFFLGICYVAAGQTDAVEQAATQLMASDPLSPLAWLLAGLAPWWTGGVADTLANFDRALEMDPANLIIYWSRGYGHALAGDVAGAARDAAVMLERAPTMPYTSQLVALVHAMEGRPDTALAVLHGVTGVDSHHKFHLAESFAMAGDSDRAYTLLEDAVNNGFHPGDFLSMHCPFFASLRGSARFEAIAATSVRLTDEFAAAGRYATT